MQKNIYAILYFALILGIMILIFELLMWPTLSEIE